MIFLETAAYTIWNTFIWVLETFIASNKNLKKHQDEEQKKSHPTPFVSAGIRMRKRSAKNYSKPSRSTRTSKKDATLSLTSNLLEEALLCFGASSLKSLESLNQESLRKHYIRLSLQHHPDRNENSPESIQKMQVINDSYDLLCNELNARRSNTNWGNESLMSTSRQKSTSTSRAVLRHLSEPIRPEIQQQQELAEINRLEKEWNKKQKRERRARRKLDLSYKQATLDTEGGRDRSYTQWVQRVHQYKVSSRKRGDEGFVQPPKPRNLMMEYSNHPIAMALRMGNSDLAIDLVSESVKRSKNKWAKYKFASTVFPLEDFYGVLEMDHSLRDLILRETLLQPLDPDGNHTLHYAVYYEQMEVLQFLANTARHYSRLEAFMTSNNGRGETALDFFIGCQNNRLSLQLQQLCKEAAAAEDPKFTFDPIHIWKKFARRKEKIDFDPTFYTVGGLMVGIQIFGCGWLPSLVMIAATAESSPTLETKDASNFGMNRHILEGHVIWYLIKQTYEICIRLAPSWMLGLPLFCLLTVAILPRQFSDWFLLKAVLPIVDVYCASISWISYYIIPLDAKSSSYHWRRVAVLLAIKGVWTKLI
jgi:curved DNA-binding protein CbpA